jgi:hypothetical protein
MLFLLCRWSHRHLYTRITHDKQKANFLPAGLKPALAVINIRVYRLYCVSLSYNKISPGMLRSTVGLIISQFLKKYASQIISQEVNYVSRGHDK